MLDHYDGWLVSCYDGEAIVLGRVHNARIPVSLGLPGQEGDGARRVGGGCDRAVRDRMSCGSELGAGAMVQARAARCRWQVCGHSAGRPTVSHPRAHRSPSAATPAPRGPEPSSALPTNTLPLTRPPATPPAATEAGVRTRGQPDQRYTFHYVTNDMSASAPHRYSFAAQYYIFLFHLSAFAQIIKGLRIWGWMGKLHYDKVYVHVLLYLFCEYLFLQCVRKSSSVVGCTINPVIDILTWLVGHSIWPSLITASIAMYSIYCNDFGIST